MANTKSDKTKRKMQDRTVNKNVDISNISPYVADEGILRCQTCGTVYKKQDRFFPKNTSSPIYAGNNGFLCTCNKCMDNLFSQYTELFGGNEERAIERICQLYDYYFCESALNDSKKVNERTSRFRNYISKLNIAHRKDKTYSDTIKENASDSVDSLEELENYDAMDAKQLKKAIGVWGFGFSPEQYSILNDQFADWKSRVVIDSKQRESLVRELCIIKLQMNVALKDNNVELYTKLMKTYQDTMKSANLQPLQEDANDKASEKPIGVMIKMFEDERPIPKPEPEWEDVDGIVRYITIYFLGHLCKMLKIKNRYSNLYEQEMAKYRVEIPELEEADDEEVFEALINGEGIDESGEKEN